MTARREDGRRRASGCLAGFLDALTTVGRRAANGAVIAAIGLPAASAGAHPHVFVTYEAHVERDEAGRIGALAKVWIFDDVYTAFALQGLPRGLFGGVRAEALAGLAADLSGRLAGVGHYTRLEAAGADVALVAEGPAATVEDGRLRLTFRLAPTAPIAAEALTLRVYDPEFYVAFTPAKAAPVRIAAPCEVAMRAPAVDEAPPADEAFFARLTAADDFGRRYAWRAEITCPPPGR